MFCCGSKPSLRTVQFVEYCMEDTDVDTINQFFDDAAAEDALGELYDSKDDVGRKPLQIACYYGSLNVLNKIVEHYNEAGVDLNVNDEDSSGATALFLACMRGYSNEQVKIAKNNNMKRSRCVRLLLDNDADPNFVLSGTKMSPLHWAAFYQDTATIRALAIKGAVLTFDFQDCSPICIAGFRGHRAVVNLFLKLFFRDVNLDEYDEKPRPTLSDAVGNFYNFVNAEMGGTNKVQPDEEEGDDSRAQLKEDEDGNEFVAVRAVEKEDLSDTELPLLRLYYWACYYDFEQDVDVFITRLGWSPFIKAYRKQNMVSAAMKGGRLEILKLIFSYKYCSDTKQEELNNSRTNKDIYLNTSYHYSYLNDSVEYREILQDYGCADQAQMNRRGKTAKDFSHSMKYNEDDDEAPQEETEVEREDRLKREFKNTPDYLFICKAATVQVVEKNLDELADLDITYKTLDSEKDDQKMICVFFTDETFDIMAEILKVQSRLKMYDYMVNFRGYASELFEQFNSRQAQYIMQETFKREMDVDFLVKAKIIVEHYPLHDNNREKIKQSWNKYYIRLMFGFITGRWVKFTQPLNFISEYYGEKMGFYFAWLIHYTAWLFVLALLGIVCFFAQVAKYGQLPELERTYDTAFDSEWSIYYAIGVSLWATAFVESWKRKQNILADTWLMRNFQDKTTERKEYESVPYVNQETTQLSSTDFVNQYLRMLFGFPVTIAFILAVVFSNIEKKILSDEIKARVDSGEYTGVQTYYLYIPTILNACLIVFFEKLYIWIAFKQVKMENHKYVSQYENSVMLKTFSFYFINSNMANFMYSFDSRDLLLLAQNLATILVFKQVAMNIFEYFVARFTTGRKLKQMRERMDEQIAAEEAGDNNTDVIYNLKLRKFVEPQTIMSKQANTLVRFYLESCTQLAYITLFSYSLTIGALFCVFTNLLEIKIKMNDLAHYKRRFPSEGSPGIGNWIGAMEFLSFLCIPMNMAVMFFISTPSRSVGIVARLNPEILTPTNVILLFVAVEHALIGIKIIVGQAIPDVPQKVFDAEAIREKIGPLVDSMIQRVKKKKGAHSYADMLREQAAAKAASRQQQPKPRNVDEMADKTAQDIEMDNAQKIQKKIASTVDTQSNFLAEKKAKKLAEREAKRARKAAKAEAKRQKKLEKEARKKKMRGKIHHSGMMMSSNAGMGGMGSQQPSQQKQTWNEDDVQSVKSDKSKKSKKSGDSD